MRVGACVLDDRMPEEREGFEIRRGVPGIHIGQAPPITMSLGEQVIRSSSATKVGGNIFGTAILTNMRFIFEPHSRDPRQIQQHRVILPLSELTELGLGKPLLAGPPMLRIGKKWHESEYTLPEAPAWLQTIEDLRQGRVPAASSVPSQGGSTASQVEPAIPCPVCGAATVRQADGSLACPRCQPTS